MIDSLFNSPYYHNMNTTISLSGIWQMRTDKNGSGLVNKYYTETFSGKTGILPGTNHTNLAIDPKTEGDLINFTDLRPYKGCIWYQRELTIDDKDRQYILFLERCCWETTLWINGILAGTENSLLSPHEYNLSSLLKKGSNTLTIMVDNANLKGRGIVKDNEMVKHTDLTQDVRQEAKLNCGGHHIWAHNFNGIIGRVELRVREKVYIVKADVYSPHKGSEVSIKVLVANTNLEEKVVTLNASAAGNKKNIEHRLSGAEEERIEFTMDLENVSPWDEFNPHLYTLNIELNDNNYQTIFAIRELKTCGVDMLLNGRKIFLRGTLEDFAYPLHGHVPTDLSFWKKEIATAKLYGLNFLRFHSCCPPEAAFAAADELGMYLQVELPGTSCPNKDEEPEVENFLFEELKNMLYYFGHHPSLLCVSMGNEQLVEPEQKQFMERHKEVLHKKVSYGKNTDPRHLYTCTSHPFSEERLDDFFVSAWPVSGGEPLCGIKWSGGPVITWSRFNTDRGHTVFDYSHALKGLDRPLITHEVGQWAVYPDMREITRYHGAQRPYNYEIIRRDLRDKNLLEFAADFTRASGMLSLILYREEIESALRTPELSGFMLLKLFDYTGQGTSPVGILSALWESKGLTTARKFTEFCSDFVPLARFEKYVWENNEFFTAEIEIANYSDKDYKGDVNWVIREVNGTELASGHFSDIYAPQGEISLAGTVKIHLKDKTEAAKISLTISCTNKKINSYDLWVYPAEKSCPVPENVIFTTKWSQSIEQILEEGGKVLYAPESEDIKNSIPGTFSPVFWNPQMKNQQVSKTMGLLCNEAHPALNEFPSEFHSNWQWQDIVFNSFAMDISCLSMAIRPVVRVIDSFIGNKSLAMIFEAKYKKGSLIICSADISKELDKRPAARQLRKSLLNYASSDLFCPDVPLQSDFLALLDYNNE